MARPIAISVHERDTYVLRDNREDPDDEQTKFEIRSLTGGENQAVYHKMFGGLKQSVSDDALSAGDGTEMSISDYMAARRMAVEFALVGWSNFQGNDGRDVPFPKNGGKAATALMSGPMVQEIGEAVLALSALTKDQERD